MRTRWPLCEAPAAATSRSRLRAGRVAASALSLARWLAGADLLSGTGVLPQIGLLVALVELAVFVYVLCKAGRQANNGGGTSDHLAALERERAETARLRAKVAKLKRKIGHGRTKSAALRDLQSLRVSRLAALESEHFGPSDSADATSEIEPVDVTPSRHNTCSRR